MDDADIDKLAKEMYKRWHKEHDELTEKYNNKHDEFMNECRRESDALRLKLVKDIQNLKELHRQQVSNLKKHYKELDREYFAQIRAERDLIGEQHHQEKIAFDKKYNLS